MIVEGLLLGLAYVLPPGPVTTETVRRSVHGGIPAALAVQLGAVGGDLCYALLVFAGLGQLLSHAAVRSAAGLLGAALLLVLGISALRGWMAGDSQIAAGDAAGAQYSLWRIAAVGLLVSLMNPFAAGFWLTAGSAAIEASPVWLAGFMTGSLFASTLTALVLGRLRGQRAAPYARWISLACGCVLIVFGLKLWWTMFKLL